MDQLSLGVMARSRKENERRLAIHPLHIERIEAGLRRRIYLERGYGERFGVPDERLAGFVAGLRPRDQLLADCDVLLLPKPLPQDLEELREGQVLWGWPHCVQNEEITQLGHRPAADPDRVRGDEPLVRRRFVQPACLP
jgi:alanine dehydrogenase